MHMQIAMRVLGRLLMVFSLTMAPPMLVSLAYGDGLLPVYAETCLATLGAGFLLWLAFRWDRREMRIRDGFFITVLFYLTLGTVGAIPLMDARSLGLPLADALFESFSGLTTTGATVLTGLDALPKSILFYRQQLQWLGGMGIIVLAVAILPMLGVGGMQLYRAETPGPIKDSKLTPRIKQTALALWSIYLGLTGLCALAYWAAGMSLFDAVCHSFSTIAIGGFSTHDASIGHFDSAAIEAVALAFMLVAGMNFALHFTAINGRSLLPYVRDDEARFYLASLLAACLLVAGLLAASGALPLGEALRPAAFAVVSIFTTTGFVTSDFSQWPGMLPYLIFFGAFAGACAGSTGGGLKAIRVLLICKQGLREINRLIHPHGVFPVKLNHRRVPSPVIEAIWGFFSIYVIVFLLTLMALLAAGLDFLTAFSATGATLNNLGPGLGELAAHYGDLPVQAKFILCFTMTLGRLEIFTLLVLFSPMFWRR